MKRSTLKNFPWTDEKAREAFNVHKTHLPPETTGDQYRLKGLFEVIAVYARRNPPWNVTRFALTFHDEAIGRTDLYVHRFIKALETNEALCVFVGLECGEKGRLHGHAIVVSQHSHSEVEALWKKLGASRRQDPKAETRALKNRADDTHLAKSLSYATKNAARCPPQPAKPATTPQKAPEGPQPERDRWKVTLLTRAYVGGLAARPWALLAKDPRTSFAKRYAALGAAWSLDACVWCGGVMRSTATGQTCSAACRQGYSRMFQNQYRLPAAAEWTVEALDAECSILRARSDLVYAAAELEPSPDARKDALSMYRTALTRRRRLPPRVSDK